MRILVLNSGSSSIKFAIFDTDTVDATAEPRALVDGELSGIGSDESKLTMRGVGEERPKEESTVDAKSIGDAIRHILDVLTAASMPRAEAVGYRVVHPGPKIENHQRITPEVLDELDRATPFAPLHNPAALAIMREGMARLPEVPHYACFDTVFHRTMPPEATTYALPETYRKLGVRRYGFHGLSCEWIVRQMRGQDDTLPKRMVIAHLGSGCSVTALLNGHSVDTTMGMTPTGGVVMGTRPGDLDPGIAFYLLRQSLQGKADAVSDLESALNHQSGVVGLTGLPNDMQEVRKAAMQDDSQALLALRVFTRSITKAIGGYCWLMGGLETIVFTGGIGEHDAQTRTEILAGLEGMGIAIDAALNQTQTTGFRRISAEGSATSVVVIPAQEDRMIALHVDSMARSGE